MAETDLSCLVERAIAGPSSSFAIGMEKSVDLTTWSPVLMGNI